MLSCIINAKECRAVATTDIQCVFMQAAMDEEVFICFNGMMAELLAKINPSLYRKHVSIVKGKLSKTAEGPIWHTPCCTTILGEPDVPTQGMGLHHQSVRLLHGEQDGGWQAMHCSLACGRPEDLPCGCQQGTQRSVCADHVQDQPCSWW